MEQRPKIKPELTTSDRFLEALSVITLVGLWALVIYAFSVLPETIPIHFDFKGQPDDYGSKASILFLPILSTLLFVGLTIINRYPHIFNYPVKITEENALRQYANATRMIRLLKLIVLFVFLTIEFFVIQTALGASAGLAIWFLPFTLTIIYLPMGYYIVRSYRQK